jgi:hypothetical protein
MATFLWVGAAGISGANIADKYNFNYPGNWYKRELINGTNRWQPSLLTPGPFDTVVFGSQAQGVDGVVANIAGWTAAKSPCLFGGFSGGLGAGSWSNWGVTYTQGTTYTSAITGLIFGSVGYDFPYFGGGISGEVAEWCADRDGVGSRDYTSESTTGFRDPSSNLKLKVLNTLYFINDRLFTKELSDGVTNTSQHTHLTKFVADFDLVKAQIGASGSAPARVQTLVEFNAARGAGLRVRGGSAKKVLINRNWTNSTGATGTINRKYDTVKDYGIELRDMYIGELEVKKYQATYVVGCTAAQVTAFPGVWGRNYPEPTYTDQVSLEYASNINALNALGDVSGITNSSDIPTNLGYDNLILSMFPTVFESGVSDVVSLPSLRSSNRQTVIVGDKFNGSISTIPNIKIVSADVAPQLVGGGSENNGAYLYMPWAVEFAGYSLITYIDNNGGYIYSNREIDPATQIKIGEVDMSNSAVVDFSSRNANFYNWKIGGISGNQVIGGIDFNDPTCSVIGNSETRLWNTQIKDNLYDARASNAKISPTVPPTTSTN